MKIRAARPRPQAHGRGSVPMRTPPAQPGCRPASRPCSPCCPPPPWSSTARTGCSGPVRPPARSAWSKGDQLVVGELLALARQVRRDGEIREGEIEVSGTKFGGRTTSFAVRVAPLGSGRRRRRPGAAAGRGPDREPPGGRGPPGLRGQHEPRAQDAGRRAGAAGRDGRGCRRRPGGGAPVRRPDAAGGVPAHQPGPGPDHAVPDPGGRADSRPDPGGPGRRGGRGAGPVPDEGQRARHRAGSQGRPRAGRARRRGPAGHRAAQPAGERGRLQPGEDPGGGQHHPGGR